MKHRSVSRPLAKRASSTHLVVRMQGPATAVVDALHITTPPEPEHAPLGTGRALTVPAAHITPPAPLTTTGAQQ